MGRTKNHPFILNPWKCFALLLLLSLAIKCSLLFTSQSYVDGDEAVIGIMAKHIMEKRASPICMYGSPYMGGAAAEAYLGAVSFSLFGVSSRSLRACGIIESTLLLLTVFLFVRKNFDGVSAIVASSLLVIAPSFVQWGTKPTSGYILGMIFTIIMLHGIYIALDKRRVSTSWAALTGLAGGLALWNHPGSIPALAATVIALFLIDIKFPARKECYIFFGFFLLGTAPAIELHLNLLRHLAMEQRVIAHPVGHFLRTFLQLWTYDFPLLFCPYQEQSAAAVYGRTPIYGWVFYAVFLAALASMIIRSVSPGRRPHATPKIRFLSRECALLLYLATFVVFYCASGRAGTSSRYLMPGFPIVLFIISIFIGRAVKGRRRLSRFSAISVFSLLFFTGLAVHVSFISKAPEIVSSGLVNEPRSGESVPDTISFLEEQNIRYILSMDHLLEWQVNFESKEKIIACRLDPTIRYKPYARLLYAKTVEEKKPYAFIWPRKGRGQEQQLHKAEASFRRFLERNDISYKIKVVNDEIAVYYGFSRSIAEHILPPSWKGDILIWAGEYPQLPPPGHKSK